MRYGDRQDNVDEILRGEQVELRLLSSESPTVRFPGSGCAGTGQCVGRQKVGNAGNMPVAKTTVDLF